jgi:glutamate--cysteine ligase catalytic subunit
MTNAAWMRHFVANHTAYKRDSVVSDEIAYDLLWKMTKIAHHDDQCPEVLPRMSSKTTLDISAAIEQANNELEMKRSLMHQINNNNQRDTFIDS